MEEYLHFTLFILVTYQHTTETLKPLHEALITSAIRDWSSL